MAISAEDQTLINTFAEGKEITIGNKKFIYAPEFDAIDKVAYENEIVPQIEEARTKAARKVFAHVAAIESKRNADGLSEDIYIVTSLFHNNGVDAEEGNEIYREVKKIYDSDNQAPSGSTWLKIKKVLEKTKVGRNALGGDTETVFKDEEGNRSRYGRTVGILKFGRNTEGMVTLRVEGDVNLRSNDTQSYKTIGSTLDQVEGLQENWDDKEKLRKRRAVLLIMQYKYGSKDAFEGAETAASAILQEAKLNGQRFGFADEQSISRGYWENVKDTKDAQDTIDEQQRQLNVMIDTFNPEELEIAFSKIQDKYLSLRKGSKDQHMLSLYATEIINSRAHSSTRGLEGSDGGQVFNVHETVDTSRLTNAMTFKMEFVKDRDYDGFLRNPMSTLTNAQLAALTPKVEFFIRTRGAETKLAKIPLQNRGLSTKGKTGVTSVNEFQSILGLQDLQVRLAGDTPETAKRDIDSTVTFYGSNLSVFDTARGRKFFLPLIQPEMLSEDFVAKDLLMKIGWSKPTETMRKALGYSDLQMKSIERQSKTFVMSYYKHSFNFNEDGSFILQVDYVSRVSETLQDADVMSESDTVVHTHYQDLVNQLKNQNQDFRANLTKPSLKMVHEYISRVHPTVTNKTKKKIVEFFKRVKKQDQIPLFVKRHTEYFQDKKSAKIKECLNRLVDKSHMHKFTIKTETYKEKLFSKAFDRVVGPHYATTAVAKLTDGMKMPDTLGGPALTVGVFKGQARFRLMITNDPEAKPTEIEAIKVQRLLVATDPSGNELPGMEILNNISVEDGEEETFLNATELVTYVKKKQGGQNVNKAVATEINEGDGSTSPGKAAKQKEIKQQRADANAKAADEAKAGKVEADGDEDAIKKAEAAKKAAEEQAKLTESQNLRLLDSEHVIYYFRLGDIIQAFLDISESEQFFQKEKVHIMLGNIKINGKYQNLYTLPISMQIYQKVMSKFENSTSRRFTLQRMITAFLKEVQRYFNQGDYVLDSGRYNSAYSMKVGQVKVSDDKLAFMKSQFPIEYWYGRGLGYEGPDATNFVYYYTMSQASTKLEIADANNLSKWEVGRDRSVIKKISFKQVESQVMKAKQDDNITKTYNSEQGLVMIPQLYNVDITSYGLIDFHPGMSFFIKPSPLGLSDLQNSPIFREVGISGLYNVINVQHKISGNGFETTFKCYNEANIDWETAIKNLATEHRKSLKSKKLDKTGKQGKKKTRGKNAVTCLPNSSAPANDYAALQSSLTSDTLPSLDNEINNFMKRRKMERGE